MSVSPKLSIIIPTYNSVAKIGNAINSILKQTFQEWELIVVDDGSTDQTRQYMKRFTDSRIHYFYIEHQGIAAARNYGNNQAQSEWLIIQDADDMSLPDRLAKIWEEVEKDKADVIVHGFYLNMWDTEFQCMMREYHGPGLIKHLLKAQTLAGYPAFRKKIWQAKPFRESTKHCYDWMMHLDWVLSGYRYRFIDQGLYEYIRYENSASQVFEKLGYRSASIRNIQKIVKKEYGKKVGTGTLN